MSFLPNELWKATTKNTGKRGNGQQKRQLSVCKTLKNESDGKNYFEFVLFMFGQANKHPDPATRHSMKLYDLAKEQH